MPEKRIEGLQKSIKGRKRPKGALTVTVTVKMGRGYVTVAMGSGYD